MSERDTKRYYWLKLHRDFFKRHDIQIIEDMPNGKEYVLFYLKLLAESIDHDGRLRFSDTVPYDEQMLSTITRTNIDIVRSACNLFSQLGMMQRLSDDTLYMAHMQNMIGSETGWARRKRVQRGDELDIVQSESNEIGHCPLELEKELELEEEGSTVNPSPTGWAAELGITEPPPPPKKKPRKKPKERPEKPKADRTSTRYKRLCDTYGKAVVEDYIGRVEAHEASGQAKRQYADYVAAADLWMKRDGIQPKPGAMVRTDPHLHPPKCPCGGKVKTADGQAMCVGCDTWWELADGQWRLQE